MPAAPASKKRSSSRKSTKVVKKSKKKVDYSRPVFGMLQTKVSRRPGPGGNALWTTLIYSERGSITTGSLGVGSGYVYRADSIFDPNFTGVGAQPVGYDQMAELYEKYIVWKTEYKVVYSNQNNALDEVCGVFISDTAPTLLDHDRFIQNGMCDWTVAERNGNGDSRVTFTGTIDLPKLHGMTKQAYLADDVHQSAIDANPPDGAYITLFGAHVDPTGSTTGLLRYEIEIRFHVKLFGNKFTILS